jgi:hypothetical protein
MDIESFNMSMSAQLLKLIALEKQNFERFVLACSAGSFDCEVICQYHAMSLLYTLLSG